MYTSAVKAYWINIVFLYLLRAYFQIRQHSQVLVVRLEHLFLGESSGLVEQELMSETHSHAAKFRHVVMRVTHILYFSMIWGFISKYL